jgi:hypothetical protein
MARAPRPLESFVSKPIETTCWLWTGARSGGYGTFSVGGRMRKAHRVAWERHNGRSVPPGLCVLHKCDNPPCVNPEHLSVGTVRENNADRASKGRSRGVFQADETHPARQRRGERHWCAKLSASAVIEIRTARSLGESTVALAQRFNVTHGTISRVARRVARQEVA